MYTIDNSYDKKFMINGNVWIVEKVGFIGETYTDDKPDFVVSLRKQNGDFNDIVSISGTMLNQLTPVID